MATQGLSFHRSCCPEKASLKQQQGHMGRPFFSQYKTAVSYSSLELFTPSSPELLSVEQKLQLEHDSYLESYYLKKKCLIANTHKRSQLRREGRAPPDRAKNYDYETSRVYIGT